MPLLLIHKLAEKIGKRIEEEEGGRGWVKGKKKKFGGRKLRMKCTVAESSPSVCNRYFKGRK